MLIRRAEDARRSNLFFFCLPLRASGFSQPHPRGPSHNGWKLPRKSPRRTPTTTLAIPRSEGGLLSFLSRFRPSLRRTQAAAVAALADARRDLIAATSPQFRKFYENYVKLYSARRLITTYVNQHRRAALSFCAKGMTRANINVILTIRGHPIKPRHRRIDRHKETFSDWNAAWNFGRYLHFSRHAAHHRVNPWSGGTDTMVRTKEKENSGRDRGTREAKDNCTDG